MRTKLLLLLALLSFLFIQSKGQIIKKHDTIVSITKIAHSKSKRDSIVLTPPGTEPVPFKGPRPAKIGSYQINSSKVKKTNK